MRYLVAYYDENGVGHLVGGNHDFVSEGEATARIRELETAHCKPHKIYYRIILYVPGERLKTMRDNNIAI